MFSLWGVNGGRLQEQQVKKTRTVNPKTMNVNKVGVSAVYFSYCFLRPILFQLVVTSSVRFYPVRPLPAASSSLRSWNKIDSTGAIKTSRTDLAVPLCLYYDLSYCTLQSFLSPYSSPCSVTWIIIRLFSAPSFHSKHLRKTLLLSVSICLWSLDLLTCPFMHSSLWLRSQLLHLQVISKLEEVICRFLTTLVLQDVFILLFHPLLVSAKKNIPVLKANPPLWVTIRSLAVL